MRLRRFQRRRFRRTRFPQERTVAFSTHSQPGLRVRSELDRGAYPSGVTITDAQMATVHLERHRFHGDWNYTSTRLRLRPVSQLLTDRPSAFDEGRLDRRLRLADAPSRRDSRWPEQRTAAQMRRLVTQWRASGEPQARFARLAWRAAVDTLVMESDGGGARPADVRAGARHTDVGAPADRGRVRTKRGE